MRLWELFSFCQFGQFFRLKNSRGSERRIVAAAGAFAVSEEINQHEWKCNFVDRPRLG